ncbi:MAG TPA: PQQ-binding-like beta-propeller repeat protein [Pirellulales bacterium]|jgi:outer membrane protein assembly factor BamB|nr:PQQ-binding-like beta-propeller repeat protein [Pirellulales bacterium]
MYASMKSHKPTPNHFSMVRGCHGAAHRAGLPLACAAIWFLLAGYGCVWPSRAQAENWPQWRGPQGNSQSGETDLPLAWNDTQGIVWKTALPEWGDSTPAIWGDAIFLTSHKDDDLLLTKVNKKTGAIEWTKTVGQGNVQRIPISAKSNQERRQQKFHPLQNLASPSPVTDGKTVVIHFGNGLLAAYNFAGEKIWEHNLQEEYGTYTIWWGHANSPVLFKNTVISVCMQDSLADFAEKPTESYLVAHDLTSGKVVWRTLRMTSAKAEECDAYTTPVLHAVGDKTELILMGGNQLDAYDPATGKQLWFLPNIVGGRTVHSPTAWQDLVFVTQGKSGPMLAVKLAGASGERSRESAVAWRDASGTPDTCCPVVSGEFLFTLTDSGISKCFEARTGQMKWKERVKGEYKASPLAAEGRIYYLNTHGLCTVVSAGERFERLSENQLDEDTIASPAVSDGRIFIRGKKNLYCLGKP